MTELKFKLKRAGKTVGYAKFSVGKEMMDHGKIRHDHLGDVWYRDPNGAMPGGEFLWFAWRTNGGGDAPIDFDSIHPFVCQDHDGRDMYEGDFVTWRGRSGKGTERYRIVLDSFQWCRDNENETNPFIEPEWMELLPDEVPHA